MTKKFRITKQEMLDLLIEKHPLFEDSEDTKYLSWVDTKFFFKEIKSGEVSN